MIDIDSYLGTPTLTHPTWAGLLDVVEGQSLVQDPPRKPARNVRSTVSSTQSSQVSSLLQPRESKALSPRKSANLVIPCKAGKMIMGIYHY